MTLDAKKYLRSALDYDMITSTIIYGISQPEFLHTTMQSRHISTLRRLLTAILLIVWAAIISFINRCKKKMVHQWRMLSGTGKLFFMVTGGSAFTALPGLLMLPHMNLGMG